MRDRPAPQFAKSLPSEKKISLAEAERAIYIDFEEFEKEAPALLGVLIDGAFEQIILDENNGNFVPLYRGHGMHIKYQGLERFNS
jgi:hypothetical protein